RAGFGSFGAAPLLTLVASCAHRTPVQPARSPDAPIAPIAAIAPERWVEPQGSTSLDPVDVAIAGLRNRNALPAPLVERPRVEPIRVRLRDLARVHVAPANDVGGGQSATAPIAWAQLRLDVGRQEVGGRWVGWPGHVFGDYVSALTR